jgi:hypothetical protein
VSKIRSPIIAAIDKALDWIEDQKRVLVQETRGMTGPRITLDDIVARFSEVKDLHARLKGITTGINQLSEHLSYELVPDQFNRAHSTVLNHEVGRVGLSTRTSASMIDREAAMKWLRANDKGDLIIETVNAQTLGATAAGMIEAGDELPDDLFKTTVKTYTTITKPGARRSKKDEDDGSED